MKAITISQPYASLIASGAKWVENRTWSTGHRGPLAIHAGAGDQYVSRHELGRYPTKCVLARAELVACVLLPHGGARQLDRSIQPRELARMEAAGIPLDALRRHEHATGPWCWVLTDIRRYREPIPCRGQPGLWDWREPENVELIGG